MPFVSLKQMKFMFSQHPEIAKRWAKETPNIKNLPLRKKKKEDGGSISELGFSKNSPYKNADFLDIHSPNGSISMKDTEFPLYGEDETGFKQLMLPGVENYQFPGSVIRETKMQQGGRIKWFDDEQAYKKALKLREDSSALYNKSKWIRDVDLSGKERIGSGQPIFGDVVYDKNVLNNPEMDFNYYNRINKNIKPEYAINRYYVNPGVEREPVTSGSGIGMENGENYQKGHGALGVYKKPNTLPKLREQEKIKILRGNIAEEPNNINYNPITNLPNVAPQSLTQQPTKYVATWMDNNQPDQTGKQYFNTEEEWKKFVYENPNYNYQSAELGKDYGTSSGSKFKEGGFKINKNNIGDCTPITKSTCTGKKKTFALNAKHHFKKWKHEEGGEIFQMGGQKQFDAIPTMTAAINAYQTQGPKSQQYTNALNQLKLNYGDDTVNQMNSLNSRLSQRGSSDLNTAFTNIVNHPDSTNNEYMSTLYSMGRENPNLLNKFQYGFEQPNNSLASLPMRKTGGWSKKMQLGGRATPSQETIDYTPQLVNPLNISQYLPKNYNQVDDIGALQEEAMQGSNNLLSQEGPMGRFNNFSDYQNVGNKILTNPIKTTYPGTKQNNQADLSYLPMFTNSILGALATKTQNNREREYEQRNLVNPLSIIPNTNNTNPYVNYGTNIFQSGGEVNNGDEYEDLQDEDFLFQTEPPLSQEQQQVINTEQPSEEQPNTEDVEGQNFLNSLLQENNNLQDENQINGSNPDLVPNYSFNSNGLVNPTSFKNTTPNKSEDVAYNYLVNNKELSPHIASGILGNLIEESDLKTSAIGDNGLAKGIAQWHPDRQKGLQSFAKSQGKDPSDFYTQLDYLVEEANQRGDLDKLKQTKSPSEAAYSFAKNFERPKIISNNRLSHAERIFKKFNK